MTLNRILEPNNNLKNLLSFDIEQKERTRRGHTRTNDEREHALGSGGVGDSAGVEWRGGAGLLVILQSSMIVGVFLVLACVVGMDQLGHWLLGCLNQASWPGAPSDGGSPYLGGRYGRFS